MYKTKRLISVIALLFATFMMIATSALPHHHHEDGSVCITLEKEDVAHNNHEEDAANHSHNGCSDDCSMKVDTASDANVHASKGGFIPVLMAIIPTGDNTVPAPKENTITTHYIYIEHHYHSIVGSIYGLRAPPAVA